MNVSDDVLRELAIKAIKELGDKATPDSVREYVAKAASALNGMKIDSQKGDSGKVILTAFGHNRPGVISKISTCLSDSGCDIQDVTQKIMQEFFTMILILDITSSPKNLRDIQEDMAFIAQELNIKIYLQHEDVFRFMHRI